jgi:Icc protein
MAPTIIAQISDLHLGGREENTERAGRAMDYLNGLDALDGILVTGDIADHGQPQEYELARKVLASPHPVYVLPGNHDERSQFRSVLLGDEPSDAPINQSVPIGGVPVVLCDSTIPGQDPGLFADETLAWLDAALDAAHGPAIVALHHNPAALQHAVLDAMMLGQADRFAAVLANHPDTVAVLCGHEHTAASTTFAGLPLLVAPGISSTLRLPWENAGLVDPDQPPAVALHILDEDNRLTTHFRVLA